jgi:hypothetical protein
MHVVITLAIAALVGLVAFLLARLMRLAKGSRVHKEQAPQPEAKDKLDARMWENETPVPGTPRFLGSLDGTHPPRRMSRPAGMDPLAGYSVNRGRESFDTVDEPARQTVQDERVQRWMRRRLENPLLPGRQPTPSQVAAWRFARANRASKATIMCDLVKAKWPGPLPSADEKKIRRFGFQWWPELGWWVFDCDRPHHSYRKRRSNWREVQGGSPGSGKRS